MHELKSDTKLEIEHRHYRQNTQLISKPRIPRIHQNTSIAAQIQARLRIQETLKPRNAETSENYNHDSRNRKLETRKLHKITRTQKRGERNRTLREVFQRGKNPTTARKLEEEEEVEEDGEERYRCLWWN